MELLSDVMHDFYEATGAFAAEPPVCRIGHYQCKDYDGEEQSGYKFHAVAISIIDLLYLVSMAPLSYLL
jgi:hypothetical protein